MSDKRAIEKLMRADLLEAGVYTPIRPPDVLPNDEKRRNFEDSIRKAGG